MNISASHTQWSRLFCLLLASIVACSLLVACHSFEEEFIIPEQETPAAQFAIANDLYRRYNAPYVPKRYRDQREEMSAKTRAAFRKVLERFPEAEPYVSHSKMGLAYMEKKDGHSTKALNAFLKLVAEYPEDDYIQAYGLYEIGSLYDDMGKHRDAKPYYRSVFQQFMNHAEKRYVQLARLSKMKHDRIWTE